MVDIVDEQGAFLAEIPLSERQQQILAADGTVNLQFHTPQLLRNLVAVDNGSFELTKQGDKIVVSDVATFKRFVELLDNIAKAQSNG